MFELCMFLVTRNLIKTPRVGAVNQETFFTVNEF